MLFSFSDFLRTHYYASDTENLFPKFQYSESSSRVSSCTVLSMCHQTSLRNNTETSAWSLNVNTEAIKLVITPVRYNTTQFCRANTFSLIFTSQETCTIQSVPQLHMHTHVQTSSVQLTISDKAFAKYNFIYYKVKVSTSSVTTDRQIVCFTGSPLNILSWLFLISENVHLLSKMTSQPWFPISLVISGNLGQYYHSYYEARMGILKLI